MKYTIVETGRSLFRLCKFMFWYLLAVAVVFLALPQAAIYLQAQYEALPVMMRLLIGLGLLMAVVAGLIHAFRSRNLMASPARLDHQSRP